MPVQPYVYIDPPDLEPVKYGLFSAVQPISGADGHWRIGGVEFESLAAYAASTYPVGIAQFGGAGGTKALPGWAGSTKGLPFSVYGGTLCASAVAHSDPEVQARALRILELAAPRAVSAALWTGAAGEQPALNAPADAQHVTVSGTATSLRLALVALENWLAANYGGRGVIHAQRGVAIRAAEMQIVRADTDGGERTANSLPERVTTPLGTVWSFGEGYNGTGPGAVAPGANQTWIYATGQVGILRDAAFLPATRDDAIDRSSNQAFVLAEQEYLLTVDGPIGAALVDLTL